ncbi:MAG: LysM peptidoglycan-binding domain-containing protein [Anaerolineae bacterium]|nr:LysM peptidoglycan-binding domain-containing protein [Anaerolineae bacterium]
MRVPRGDDALYDPMYGEDDLLAARAPGGLWTALLLLGLGIVAAGLLIFGASQLAEETAPDAAEGPGEAGSNTQEATEALMADTPEARPTAAASPTSGQSLISGPTLPATNTRMAVQLLPTITPTITLTPTLGPCEYTMRLGETLFDLALRCGHRDLSAVQAIVSANNLACDSCVKEGDTIIVPRPTSTPDPNPSSANPPSAPTEVADVGVSFGGLNNDIDVDNLIEERLAVLEPTLDPNLQWHEISQGQTLYEIVAIYEIDVKLLSEINPEVDFLQCDFGERFGGETCSVFFSIGQRIRVPAPTPTPTIPPTLSGSETPTPSPTATFNVPQLFAPREGQRFEAASLVTLRWVTTGTLGVDEVYVLRVRRPNTDQNWVALTCDLAFDLPTAWQAPSNDTALYEWSVSIGRVASRPGTDQAEMILRRSSLNLCQFSTPLPIDWEVAAYAVARDVGVVLDTEIVAERYPTPPRRFSWQGRVP